MKTHISEVVSSSSQGSFNALIAGMEAQGYSTDPQTFHHHIQYDNEGHRAFEMFSVMMIKVTPGPLDPV